MLLTCRCDGLLAEEQLLGDRAVGLAGGDQPQHLDLARGQAAGRVARRPRATAASTRARSGAAPSCWNTQRAASSSISAVSSSPSARHADADQHPHPRAVVRRVELPPRAPGAAQRRQRRARVALGQRHRAVARAARRAAGTARPSRARDRGQLVGRRARARRRRRRRARSRRTRRAAVRARPRLRASRRARGGSPRRPRPP